MPIKPRGNAWLVTVCVSGKRRAGTAYSEVEAKKLETELETQLKDEVQAVRVWTLGEAVEKTTKHYWLGAKAERSSTLNASLIERRFGKPLKLDQIDLELIEEWVDELRAMGNSDATVNRKLACLSKILNTAVEMGGLPQAPALSVFWRKEGKGRIRWVTYEEEKALLDLLKQWGKDLHAAAIVVLMDTGIRCGELFALEARDVDLKAGQIRIWENKADLPRSVPLTSRAKGILEDRVKVRPTGPLFPDGHWWLSHTWNRAKVALGLANDAQWVPHVLRHTCASRLVQAGVPLATVQRLLGHKCIQVTMRYSHLAPQNLFDARDALERFNASGSPSGSNPVALPTPQAVVQEAPQSSAG